jgi:glutaminyl-tRNA synthetase
MAVLNPLKVIITNYPDDKTEDLEAINNPEDLSAGTRKLEFSKVVYIEQDDFKEIPPPKFKRLIPGGEVRLKNAYIIKCDEVIKNENGDVIELHCTFDPETKSGSEGSKRKVKGTIHWVSASNAIKMEVRLYDRLFLVENPDADAEKDFKELLNPHSLDILNECLIEPGIANAKPGDKFQFERLGYFCVDPLSNDEKIVFNRTVSLRDTWAKIETKNK